MFFKRNKIKVVPASELTDYSERFSEFEKMREEDKQFATRKHVAMASAVPAVVGAGLIAQRFLNNAPQSNTLSTVTHTIMNEPTNVLSTLPTTSFPEPSTLTEAFTPLTVNATVQQTGVIADASLEMLATILDPVIQILVAISFPIASVIMIGACFFFMFGNSEKAWSMILNAGLGYVLIQLSPLFLEILRTVGEAV